MNEKSVWQPIETAPKDMTRIIAAGLWRRADPGDPLWVDIIFWSWSWEWREVLVGDGLYRKEKYKIDEQWRQRGHPGDVTIDWEPYFWMPLPKAPANA